jgi:hypothetical protein
LVNSGVTATEIFATASNTDSNISIVTSTLAYADVTAGGTASPVNTFSFTRPSTYSFNASALQWNIQTPNTPINLSLLDSGTYDDATGDGIYTGTFMPTDPGTYTVLLTASGTSNSGLPFIRTASAAFRVITPAAQLGAFADAAINDPFTGGLTNVNVTASVTVQTAGYYQLSTQLVASNGNTVTAWGSAQLSTGTGSVVVSFPASALSSLGTNGPYTMHNASLFLAPPGDSILADYKDPVGTTQAYTLSSISQGQLYFTGQNSVTGVITGSGPKFDVLRLQAGVYNAAAGPCGWQGTLTDLNGLQIDYETGTGPLVAGTQSITLDFNGNRIAQTGTNGPYLINFGIQCGSNSASAAPLIQTQAFTASQFTYVPPDFLLASSPTSLTIAAGTTGPFSLTLTPSGAFNGAVNLSVAPPSQPLPATLTGPTLIGSGIVLLLVSPSATAAAGTVPLTVSYSSGTVTKTLTVNPTITTTLQPTQPVTFSPPAGTYGSAQTVALSSTTSGASIRYTTDGSTPSETAGTLYAGQPVAVSITTTISAIAYASGMADSAVASATYTIASTVATPTFSPVAGTFTTSQTVTISTTTSGSSIRYTIDGGTPSETAGTLYTGPVTVNSTTTIRAIAYASGMVDSAIASATYTIALAVSTNSLPNSTVNVFYFQQLTATAGTSPFNWSLATGSTLPAGMTLTSSGSLGGVPTASGNSSFTVQVSDSASPSGTASKTLNLTVAAVAPLAINPGSLSTNGTVGVASSQTLTAAGGVVPLTWSVATGSTLPQGLSLANNGVLSGTPTSSGSFSFTIQVSDSNSSTSSQSFSMTVYTGLTIATPPALPGARLGFEYYQFLAAARGTSPYTWSVASGSALPSGFTLSSVGLLSGHSAPAKGNFSFILQLNDSANPSVAVTQTFSLAIADTVVIGTAPALPNGTAATPYSQTLSGTGGPSPYSWSIVWGSAGGLSLSGSGVLSGTPAAAGNFSFTVEATDASSSTFRQVFNLTVVAGGNGPSNLVVGPSRIAGVLLYLSVTNVGGSSTNGSLVTVNDTLPSGWTAAGIGGPGWTCTLSSLQCTRSDVLSSGASYAPITILVSLTNNNLTNTATVTGGGSSPSSNTATDTGSLPAGGTAMGGSFGTKTGAMNARVWTIIAGNNGPESAFNAQIGSLALTQTSGTACTPVVSTPFPLIIGNIQAPQRSAISGGVTIDFSACTGTVFFKAVAQISAGGGGVTGTITRLNQLP